MHCCRALTLTLARLSYKSQILIVLKPTQPHSNTVDYKTIKSRHERELNKIWRDSVDHSKWNIRRSIEGQFTRQERTTLAQIRTGHCVLLKTYRKRIGLEDDGICETCSIEEEDREHLLGSGEMSGVETGVTGNLWEDAPVPQGTYQGGSRGHHRLPAADWPASGQRQCIAGGATQQQQQHSHYSKSQSSYLNNSSSSSWLWTLINIVVVIFIVVHCCHHLQNVLRLVACVFSRHCIFLMQARPSNHRAVTPAGLQQWLM